jgi:hypothetical protein
MITHDLLPCAGEVTEMRMVETADQVQCIVDQHSIVTAVVISLEFWQRTLVAQKNADDRALV